MHVLLILTNAYLNNFNIQTPIRTYNITIHTERFLISLPGFPRGNHSSGIFYLFIKFACFQILGKQWQFESFSGLLLWHRMFLRFICIVIYIYNSFLLLIVFHDVTKATVCLAISLMNGLAFSSLSIMCKDSKTFLYKSFCNHIFLFPWVLLISGIMESEHMCTFNLISNFQTFYIPPAISVSLWVCHYLNLLDF